MAPGPGKDVTEHGEHEYEFFGPPGAVAIQIGLPLVTYGLYYTCTQATCVDWKVSFDAAALTAGLPTSVWEAFSVQATAVFLGWMAFQALLYYIAPGRVGEGVVLPTGKRLRYPFNAFSGLIITAIVLALSESYGVFHLSWIRSNFVQLITAAWLFSIALSVYLYAKSFTPYALLAEGGQSGNVIYDFFIGRELNPREGAFDWKYFCELRPGLIGWLVIDAGFALYQYETLGRITNSMALVVLCHGVYVVDALWFEPAILTTMDITSDGFGWMLVFGDLVWVPFTYSLQARYLADHVVDLSLPFAVAVLALNVAGYTIFRLSNLEKDTFRTNPHGRAVSHLETLQTKRGTRLIVSSWWGMCRKPNYLGDWIQGLSWSLATGCAHAIPFFYPIYFAVLLIHRSLRDDAACRKKYGDDWKTYCEKVRWRIVPYIF